jgi:hypothetical protein
LALAHGQHTVHGLHAHGQGHGNPVAFQWVGCGVGDGVFVPVFDFRLAVHGFAQSVQDTPQQFFRNLHGDGPLLGFHRVAWADATHIAQGHQ